MVKLTPTSSMLDFTSDQPLSYSNRLVNLVEICHLSRALLSVTKTNIQFHERIEKTLGIPLPLEPNTSVYGDCAVKRISSRSWFITGKGQAMAQLFKNADASELKAEGTSLIDVSDAYVRIQLQGPAVRDLISTGCSLNFASNLNQRNTCAVTMLAKTSVILSVEPNGSINIDTERSRALYLWTWLKTSAVEFEDSGTSLLLLTEN